MGPFSRLREVFHEKQRFSGCQPRAASGEAGGCHPPPPPSPAPPVTLRVRIRMWLTRIRPRRTPGGAGEGVAAACLTTGRPRLAPGKSLFFMENLSKSPKWPQKRQNGQKKHVFLLERAIQPPQPTSKKIRESPATCGPPPGCR